MRMQLRCHCCLLLLAWRGRAHASGCRSDPPALSDALAAIRDAKEAEMAALGGRTSDGHGPADKVSKHN